jgi:hypothetical protein
MSVMGGPVKLDVPHRMGPESSHYLNSGLTAANPRRQYSGPLPDSKRFIAFHYI